MDLSKMKPPITASQAMAHPAVFETAGRAEVDALTKERDIAVRKLSALSSAHALENLYQAGLDQEREITRLKKERDALAEDAGRYRWLCANGLFAQSEGYDTQIGIDIDYLVSDINTSDINTAIDAAIVKEARQAGVQ